MLIQMDGGIIVGPIRAADAGSEATVQGQLEETTPVFYKLEGTNHLIF